VEAKYMSLVNGGELQYDENQYQIILQFMKVQKACKLPKLEYDESTASFFGTLWETVTKSKAPPPPPVAAKSVSPDEDRRGIYLYGSVGIGKTLMMDMLYDTTEMEQKRRVHFHKVCSFA
jgi:cell division protein ZapE